MVHLSFRLTVSPFVYRAVHLLVRLSDGLSNLSVRLSVRLFVCQSVCLSGIFSVGLFVHLSLLCIAVHARDKCLWIKSR